MKILLGTYNIASQLNDWKYGFEANGCKVTIAAYNSKNIITEGNIDVQIESKFRLNLPFRSYTLNKVYNKLMTKSYGDAKYRLLKRLITEHDAFFYIWSGFYDDFTDFELIKSAGKKLIVQFVGNDVRWDPAMRQQFKQMRFYPIEYENYDYSLDALQKKLMYLRKAEKYADLIYSAPNQSQLALRPYSVNNQPININDFPENPNQRKIPKILHLPSNFNAKGTKYVLECIEKLKSKKIHFEFIMPENKLSYSEAKRLYTDIDILIGQLLLPGGGKQERELLAIGKVVLSIVERSFEKYIDVSCPIIDVNPNTLLEKLEAVILNWDERKRLASIGREYIKKFHDAKNIASSVLKDLESGYTRFVDYPTFFRNSFIPESVEYEFVYNRWNEYLSDTDWYKDNIPKGIRSGLVF